MRRVAVPQLAMKARLNFSLPEDSAEFNAALCGGRALATLVQIDNHLRNSIKYEELSNEAIGVLQVLRDLIPADLLEA